VFFWKLCDGSEAAWIEETGRFTAGNMDEGNTLSEFSKHIPQRTRLTSLTSSFNDQGSQSYIAQPLNIANIQNCQFTSYRNEAYQENAFRLLLLAFIKIGKSDVIVADRGRGDQVIVDQQGFYRRLAYLKMFRCILDGGF